MSGFAVRNLRDQSGDRFFAREGVGVWLQFFNLSDISEVLWPVGAKILKIIKCIGP